MSDAVATETGADNEHRHESLYFQDGDIVLSAPHDEQRTWLFRVDKIFLARHSSIFRDMLSLPAKSDINEEYDGVPRVRLADDALHLSQLLAGIYDPASLPLQKQVTNVPDLYNIMKLAVKYEVKTVQLLIKRHVESAWSFSLLKWERRELRNQDNPGAWLAEAGSLQSSICVADMVPEPASAIRFAVDFGCRKMLPLAFLDLSLVPSDNDWESKDSDFALFDRERCLHLDARHARWDLLRAPELLALMRGKDLLISRWHALVRSLEEKVFSHTGGKACAADFQKRMRDFSAGVYRKLMQGANHQSDSNALLDARRLRDEISEWSICQSCEVECDILIVDWAEVVWGDLPKIFAVDTISSM